MVHRMRIWFHDVGEYGCDQSAGTKDHSGQRVYSRNGYGHVFRCFLMRYCTEYCLGLVGYKNRNKKSVICYADLVYYFRCYESDSK